MNQILCRPQTQTSNYCESVIRASDLIVYAKLMFCGVSPSKSLSDTKETFLHYYVKQ